MPRLIANKPESCSAAKEKPREVGGPWGLGVEFGGGTSPEGKLEMESAHTEPTESEEELGSLLLRTFCSREWQQQ